jgi:hypothetical protein
MKPTPPPERTIPPETPRRSDRMDAARYALGGVVVLTAVVVLALVPGDIGFTSAMAYGSGSALGATLIMLLLNLLYRAIFNRDRKRDADPPADERVGQPPAGRRTRSRFQRHDESAPANAVRRSSPGSRVMRSDGADGSARPRPREASRDQRGAHSHGTRVSDLGLV